MSIPRRGFKAFSKTLAKYFSKYFQPPLKLPILLALQTPSSSELEGTQKGLREARMGAVPTAQAKSCCCCWCQCRCTGDFGLGSFLSVCVLSSVQVRSDGATVQEAWLVTTYFQCPALGQCGPSESTAPRSPAHTRTELVHDEVSHRLTGSPSAPATATETLISLW